MDLRHAQFGVQSEEEPSVPNGQVVLTPVPKILQVLVVDGGERIHAGDEGDEEEVKTISYSRSTKTH